MKRWFWIYFSFVLTGFVVKRVKSQSVQRSSDLNCDFESRCSWRNGTAGTEDNFEWLIASSVVLDSWHSIPRAKDGPGDLFSYTRGRFSNNAQDTAWLISPVIQCQTGSGQLKFWFWKTANLPSLDICIRRPPGARNSVSCVDQITGIHAQQWVMRTSTIPQQDSPFELIFRAKFKYNFDIIGLDEISYNAQICDFPVSTEIKVKLDKAHHRYKRSGLNHGLEAIPLPPVSRRHPFLITDRSLEVVQSEKEPSETRQSRFRPMLIVAQNVEPQIPRTVSNNVGLTNHVSKDIAAAPGTLEKIVPDKVPPSTTTITVTEPLTVAVTNPIAQAPLGAVLDTSVNAAGAAAGSSFPSWFAWVRQIAPLVPYILNGAARDDSAVQLPTDPFLPFEPANIPKLYSEFIRENEVEKPLTRRESVVAHQYYHRAAPSFRDGSTFSNQPRPGYPATRPAPPPYRPTPFPQYPDRGGGSFNGDGSFEPNRGGPGFNENVGGGFDRNSVVDNNKDPGGPCDAVDCSFDQLGICQYRTGITMSLEVPAGVTLQSWKVTDQQVSNSLTGIFTDASAQGGYTYAGLTNGRSDYFVLSSAVFTTRVTTRLDFDYYMAGIRGRLRLCVNDLNNCPFENLGENIKLDARQWQRANVLIDPGTQVIHFVADNLQKHYVIGLDNIALRKNEFGEIAGTCYKNLS